MTISKSLLLALLAWCVTAATPTLAADVKQAPAPAEKLTLRDLEGRPVDPFADNPAASVFIFIAADCPISNRYVPALRELAAAYQHQAVRFWMIHVDPSSPASALRAHRDAYGLSITVLVDTHHALVTKAKVSVTPEVAVFGPGQKLVYHGRIDNRFAGLGKSRPKATKHDLKNALNSLLQGKPVARSSVPAVGCPIPRLP